MGLITKLAERLEGVKKPKSTFKELGASGTEFFSGFITNEEYLPKLTGSLAIKTYDKMRRTDSQIKGIIQSLTLPIRGATWQVEPPTDKPKDKEIAKRLQKNLMQEMSITWDDFLRQAMTYMFFGFSMFEKVWGRTEDGLTLMRKLAPRLQGTLYKWLTDENDGFAGITQYAQKDGKFDYITIPADKMVIFVNDQEGSNFEGTSILRSAYRNWFIKDRLWKIDAIGHERFSAGTPFANEPEDANDDDRERVSTIMQNLRSRERSFLHAPHGWELGILDKQGGNNRILDSIQQHNVEMSVGVLAQFINLGSTGTGSRALGESFEELFMMSLNAVADYFAGNMNRYVIKQLVDFNWNVDEYPRLTHSRILLNINKFFEGLSTIGGSNMLNSDINIENIIRQMAGLPEKIEEEEEETPKPLKTREDAEPKGKEDAPEIENDVKASDKACGMIHLAERKPMRGMTELEKLIIDPLLLESTLDDGVERITKAIKRIRKKQIEDVSRQAVKKQPDKVKPPLIGTLAEKLQQEYIRLFRKGKLRVSEEINRQKMIVKQFAAPVNPNNIDPEDNGDVVALLRSKAKRDATILTNNLITAALFATANVADGSTQEQQISQIEAELLANSAKAIKKTAGAGAVAAFSSGRNVGAKAFKEQIEFGVYSAILDRNSCDNCIPKDGVKHELDDPNFMTPNVFGSDKCLGGDFCRCITIYKLKDSSDDLQTISKTESAKIEKQVDKGSFDFKDARNKYE